MRTVFSAHLLKFFEQGDRVKLVVAIGVLQAVEAAALVAFFIHDNIEGIKGVTKSPGVTNIEVDFLEIFICESFARGWSVEAVKRTVLVTGDETPLVVLTENDP